MKKRNKTDKLSNRIRESTEPELNRTPSKSISKTRLENDYSPIFIPNTQEAAEEIDVVWDWNSPQTKTKVLRKPKRSTVTQSPKLPIKRQLSNTQIQSFNKLREELDALRDEFSNTNKSHKDNSTELPKCKCSIDFNENKNKDAFKEIFEDDSIEEQLLLCSQEVENTFHLEHHQKKLLTCDRTPKKNNPNWQIPKKASFDDSFDVVLETFQEEDFDILTQSVSLNVTETKKSSVCVPNLKLHSSGTFSSSRSILPESSSDVVMKTIEDEGSPIKCSPEEIELKRQQALAKLKVKKQMTVERNRQEALKRLENNRKKRILEKHNSFSWKKGNCS